MDNFIGCPLKEALEMLYELEENKIISIKKVIGTNNRFKNLNNPYVIRQHMNDNYITFFVSYY